MNILGFDVTLPDWLEFAATPPGTFLVNLLAWFLITLAVYVLVATLIRRFTRHSRTRIDDLLLRIVRRPLVILTLSYGAISSWQRSLGESPFTASLQRLYHGILIILGAYVIWRVLFEVVVAYLKPRVQESDSQADDIIVPVLRRIGPVVIIIAVANGVVATLGGNLGTLMAGLGLLGLVLGYLLQEPLQGLFSGTYMSLDNPFHEDDLLMLEDGSTCQVRGVGVRVTQLYDVRRHVLQFMPNSRLSSTKIINLTKPSVELRNVLTISFPKPFDSKEAIAILQEACNSHENVLGLWSLKEPAIHRRMDVYRQEAEQLTALAQRTPADEMRLFWLRDHLVRMDGELIRLFVEKMLRERGEEFSGELLALSRFCQQVDNDGSLIREQQHIKEWAVQLMDHYDLLIEQITVWLFLVKTIESELTDQADDDSVARYIERAALADGRLSLQELEASGVPNAPKRSIVQRDELSHIRSSDAEADLIVDPAEFRDRAAYVDYRRLYIIWHRNITHVYRGLQQIYRIEHLRWDQDHSLADRVRAIERHLADTFLLRLSYRQLPTVNMVDTTGAELKFEVAYFVDDVVREHFQRKERVTTELLMEIERLRAVGQQC